MASFKYSENNIKDNYDGTASEVSEGTGISFNATS
jgi:hypothetical protein